MFRYNVATLTMTDDLGNNGIDILAKANGHLLKRAWSSGRQAVKTLILPTTWRESYYRHRLLIPRQMMLSCPWKCLATG